MSRPHKLADHVRPRLPEARIDRQWAAIEAAGLPGPAPARSRRGMLFSGAVGLAAVGAALALVVHVRAPQSLPAGALLESPEAGVAVQLEDGSRVELAPRAQLQLLENRPQEVALELRSGSARFVVTHDRARRFAIKAGAAEVRVIGTRFALTRTRHGDRERVHLAVEQGVVEVRRDDRDDETPQRVHAGEAWSAVIRLAAEPGDGAHPEAEPPAREAQSEKVAEPRPPAPEPLPSKPTTAAGKAPDAQRESEAQPERRRSRELGPSELFSRASLSRRAGQMREAADGYAELLARHPRDGRAGLSAFELGRIRMDALGDPEGAITALEQALRSGGRASFHEDALARIVIAHDALQRIEDCREARARYLARYPRGVHAHALQARCR